MTIIPLIRKDGKLYIESIGKFVKPKEIFAPVIISYGMYSSKDNEKAILDLRKDLIIKGDMNANAYEIGEQHKNDKAIHAVGIYRIKESLFRKALGINLFDEIRENLFSDF